MRVIVDRQRCLGAGQCALAAPGLFDQSDVDGRVLMLVERPGEEHFESMREAALLCPSGAVQVIEDGRPRASVRVVQAGAQP
jgi:ferredoxin